MLTVVIMSEADEFHLVNVEPFTSELYNTLVEPSLSNLESRYVEYARRPLTRENLYKALCVAPIRGCGFAIWKSFISVTWHNVKADYEKQNPKPPIDMFVLRSYVDLTNYPTICSGLTKELKIETLYQMTRASLGTFAKYQIPSKSDSIWTNIGITAGRSFVTNVITSSTIYPTSLYAFGGYDAETVFQKVLTRTTRSSVKNAGIAVGIQALRSLMPSYSNILKFGSLLTGAT